jgi:hypothetical protein
MRLRRFVSPIALVSLAIALTACGPTPGPTESPEPETTPTPSVTPTPEPDPEPVAATCENLLSTSLAEYSAIGISGPGSYADKLQSEGNAFYEFYEAGGVFCFVGQVEADALYGWAPFDDAGWETIRAANLSDGWSEEVTDAGFLMRSPYPQPLQVCYYRPGEYGACAVSDAVLDEIIANAPAT